MPTKARSPGRGRPRKLAKAVARPKASSKSRSRSTGRKSQSKSSLKDETTTELPTSEIAAREPNPLNETKSSQTTVQVSRSADQQEATHSSIIVIPRASLQLSDSALQVADTNNNAGEAEEETKKAMLDGVGDYGVLSPRKASTANPSRPKSFINRADFQGACLAALAPAIYLFLAGKSLKDFSLCHYPRWPESWRFIVQMNELGVVLSWYIGLAVASAFPIGPIAKGQPLKDGTRVSYRCNGWYMAAVGCIALGMLFWKGFVMNYIESHWLQLNVVSLVLSYLLAVLLYAKGRRAPASLLAPSVRVEGSFLSDFWTGTELNPRISGFDLKLYLFRSGLLSWMLVIWCLLASQYQTLGSVKPALALVTIMQTLYIMGTLKNESSILSTFGVMAEGVGFMMTLGFMCFAPFVYPLQARFLFLLPNEGISNIYVLLIAFLLNGVGLVLYRASNWQKNEFRMNPYSPHLAALSSIPTSQGKRLLCSGWWGMCRHPNYLGDLLMAVSWSLPCGFSYALPFFYPVFLLVLLLERCWRNEKSCSDRYGASWDKYTAMVKYRLLPYIY